MKAKMLLAGLILCAGIGLLSAKELKVLMIGNSFSVCVGKNLPQIVHSFPGHKLELTSAYIGGCPLDKHVKNIKLAEKDPKKGLYGVTIWNSDNPTKQQKYYKGNLVDLLNKQQYDIVTIQQSSPKSWDWKTYEPSAGELIAYVRKCQPKAEIVIQQTWSYRADSPRYQKFGFDQTAMYEKIRDAYGKLAEKYQFRVIPMGDAVQLFRKYTPVKFVPPTEKLEYPKAPSNAGDVVGYTGWRKNEKTGKMDQVFDPHHLNGDGRYMQACQWFAFLYGESAEKIKWAPKDMKPELAALIRKCAQEALDNYKQVK